MSYEWRRGDYIISTDKQRLDITVIHNFLTQAYWSSSIPRETVEQALKHSLAFGLYKGQEQIGLARLVTDYTTFAYLADVFILEPYRGQGLSKWLLEVITTHPELQGLRRWLLATQDAHGLYQQFGFAPPRYPERLMEILHPDIYNSSKTSQAQ
ncbi:GNAT family N-acetyltransferase [Dictyobacter kobayashii]|uniref:N-acetyltransferase n=1 Tax=Dictyobacter kobayashii TaxID=2014872 RepID=A0A402AC49_9CHLR|nr:GNAT family N-acetyltransferase [Dictyobacter kobayashii]GCE16677.1 N-acetyltransferase [Dictyobacter kobayashii]